MLSGEGGIYNFELLYGKTNLIHQSDRIFSPVFHINSLRLSDAYMRR